MITIKLHWLRRFIQLVVFILMACSALHFSPMFFSYAATGVGARTGLLRVDLSVRISVGCSAPCPVKGALKIAARPAAKSDQNRNVSAEVKEVL